MGDLFFPGVSSKCVIEQMFSLLDKSFISIRLLVVLGFRSKGEVLKQLFFELNFDFSGIFV